MYSTLKKWNWIDLSPPWDKLQRIATEINAIKRNSRLTLPPNNYSARFDGLCSEYVYSIVTGQKMNLDVYLSGGDGGIDFGDVDVKGNKYWNGPKKGSPYLIVHTEIDLPLRAAKYVLVGLDMPGKRGYIAGWATREEVRSADIDEWGYGPRYSIPCYKLRPFETINM